MDSNLDFKTDVIRLCSNEPQPLYEMLLPKWQSYKQLNLPEAPVYNENWPYVAAPTNKRLETLEDSLHGSAKLIWSARGGFGASDLIDKINYQSLRRKSKIICGFSDVSALISAFYTKLGWTGIHCPMPFTIQFSDFEKLSEESAHHVEKLITSGKIDTRMALKQTSPHLVEGPIFGGNLAVLTNLIGTPYIPQSLAEHILLFEDISEHPARVIRFLNQWKHAGLFHGVKAIILGDFKQDLIEENCNDLIRKKLQKGLPIPIFSTDDFGHGATNFPFAVGQNATIIDGYFTQKFFIKTDD